MTRSNNQQPNPEYNDAECKVFTDDKNTDKTAPRIPKDISNKCADNAEAFYAAQTKIENYRELHDEDTHLAQENHRLEDESYICLQKRSAYKKGSKAWWGCLIGCYLKYFMLFFWEALWVIVGLAGIYMTWDGNLARNLEASGLPLLAGSESTFKVISYTLFAGITGGATYAICAIYAHIVYPKGNAFTSKDDQADDKDEAQEQAERSRNKYSVAETRRYKLRREQRRFCSEARIYWFLRPLVGAVGGVFSFIFFDLLTAVYTKQPECGNGLIVNAVAFTGTAFIAGAFFGDFLKFLASKSKDLFKTKPSTPESKVIISANKDNNNDITLHISTKNDN